MLQLRSLAAEEWLVRSMPVCLVYLSNAASRMTRKLDEGVVVENIGSSRAKG